MEDDNDGVIAIETEQNEENSEVSSQISSDTNEGKEASSSKSKNILGIEISELESSYWRYFVEPENPKQEIIQCRLCIQKVSYFIEN